MQPPSISPNHIYPKQPKPLPPLWWLLPSCSSAYARMWAALLFQFYSWFEFNLHFTFHFWWDSCRRSTNICKMYRGLSFFTVFPQHAVLNHVFHDRDDGFLLVKINCVVQNEQKGKWATAQAIGCCIQADLQITVWLTRDICLKYANACDLNLIRIQSR